MIFCVVPPEVMVMMPGRSAATIGAWSGQHAEIAFGARDIDLIDFTRESELFRRDEIEVEGGHDVIH